MYVLSAFRLDVCVVILDMMYMLSCALDEMYVLFCVLDEMLLYCHVL